MSVNYFRTLLAAFVIVNLVGISLTSCIREEDYADGNGVELKFGNDTVSFDTIFTTVSSLTKTLMVYNDESKPIKIDRISLREGAASLFSALSQVLVVVQAKVHAGELIACLLQQHCGHRAVYTATHGDKYMFR